MQRPDWPTTRSVRYALLPIVSLLADRFSRTFAPAIACNELGGIGIQRSSQISTPTDHARAGVERAGRCRTGRAGRRNVTSRRLGAVAPAEPAALVELLVVREELLRDDPEHPAVVERPPRRCNRLFRPRTGRPTTTSCSRPAVASAIRHAAALGGLQQRRLAEQVGAGVAGQAQLGEQRRGRCPSTCSRTRRTSPALASGSATTVRSEAQVRRTKPNRFMNGHTPEVDRHTRRQPRESDHRPT